MRWYVNNKFRNAQFFVKKYLTNELAADVNDESLNSEICRVNYLLTSVMHSHVCDL